MAQDYTYSKKLHKFMLSATTDERIDMKGIAVMFSSITDETSTSEAEITDNWVETNYSIQDHIAIKPRVYRLRGVVGEVVHINTNEFRDFIKNKFQNSANHPVLSNMVSVTTTGISALGGVFPIVSNYTNAAMAAVDQIESSYKRYEQIWENLTGQSFRYEDKKQKFVYSWLRHVLENRIEVKLDDLMFDFDELEGKPLFKYGSNYARKFYLQSVSAHQGDNAFISDIEVVIKEFRIATTKVTTLDPSKYKLNDVPSTTIEKANDADNGPASTQKDDETIDNLANINKDNEYDALFGHHLKGKHPTINNLCQKIYRLIPGAGNVLQTAEDYKEAYGK